MELFARRLFRNSSAENQQTSKLSRGIRDTVIIVATAFFLLHGPSPAFGGDTTPKQPALWDTFSDTWVATDGLGRTLPTYEQVGGPKPDKTVGMFYYLWEDSHQGKIRDAAKILAANPHARIPLENDDWYWWGEPLLGYYLLSDPFVLRTHAAMLSDAGVDAAIFDSSNGYTHTDQYTALCSEYESLRKIGQATPTIAHLLNAKTSITAQTLYDDFYSKHLDENLWFQWDGKPLLMADPAEVPESIRDLFTIRRSWAWHKPTGWFGDGKDRWPWIDVYPQQFGWHDDPNVPEELSVSAAQHPSSTIGRSYHNGKEPAAKDQDPAAGLYFAEQWKQALKISPEMIFVTNFNEWIAKGYGDDRPKGKPRYFIDHDMEKGEAFFVDEFDPEFSRDIEPAAPTVANRGVDDNYYYQLVANIRRYKGVRPLPAVASQPIRIDGQFDEWKQVTPEFRDRVGDPVHRDFDGFGPGTHYTNQTGRNDIVAAKVSEDAENIYFYVRTADAMTPHTDPDWMVLYLDTDHNTKTGWLGYDFAVNLKNVRDGLTTLSKNVDGRYEWTTVSEDVRYVVKGNEMELAIPRGLLKLGTSPATIDFKWADHCFAKGDWTDFTLNGDAAPDARFNFRAKLK
jgi:hypothetical protein